MRFKIGDFVRFVDEAIEGHVTSIQANDIIGVTDDSGFEIPVPITKVTAVHGNMKRDDDEEQEEAAPAVFIDKGVYLAVTGEQRDGLAKFHILNETSFRLVVALTEIQNGKRKGHLASVLPANSVTEFYTANFSAIGKWPVFSIRIIKYSESPQIEQPVIEEEVRVKPSILNEAKIRHRLIDEKAWLVGLDDEKQDIGLDRLKNFGKS